MKIHVAEAEGGANCESTGGEARLCLPLTWNVLPCGYTPANEETQGQHQNTLMGLNTLSGLGTQLKEASQEDDWAISISLVHCGPALNKQM